MNKLVQILFILGILIISTTSQQYEYLPDETKPLSYDLHIKTNIHKGEFEYEGIVKIHLLAMKNTNQIVIHSKNLNISEMSLINLETTEQIDNLIYEYHENYFTGENDSIIITSDKNSLRIEEGKDYILIVTYTGLIRENLRGFYRTSYKDRKNNTVLVASTHFQRSAARSAFPCYDEPGLKAKFRIIITHGENFTALSNMPAEKIEIDHNMKMTTTTFAETPLMPTYTVAFIISNYKYITKTSNGITHRLHYQPNATPKRNFLKTAIRIFNWYENYFHIKYPLPKLDHIGVPRRIGRAMENWGLIIYVDFMTQKYVNVSTLRNIQSRYVMGHELAHNWFGNLVTPSRWMYAWLSEGLSTFYSYKVLEVINPELLPLDFAVIVDYGITVFSKQDLFPITFDPKIVQNNKSSFQSTTYYKAAFILRMFEHTLSEPVFRKGIKNFLEKFEYSTVDENDLLDSLQEVAKIHNVPFLKENDFLKQAIKSWTHQKGHPTLKVIRYYNSGLFQIEQQNLDDDKNSEDDDDDNDNIKESRNLWWIPVTFTTGKNSDFKNTTFDFVISGIRSITIDPMEFNKVLKSDDWLILNKEQIGPYRVNYDDRNWDLLTNALLHDPNSIPSYNRAQLIRDAGTYFQRNLLSASIVFKLFTYLKNEKDPAPWYEGYNILSSIFSEFKGGETRELLTYFLRSIVKLIFEEIGVKPKFNETAMKEYIRPRIFTLACLAELENCIQSARLPSRILEENKKYIPLNMIFAMYHQTLRYSDDVFYKDMFNRFIATNGEEHTLLSTALLTTDNPNLLRFFLKNVVNNEYLTDVNKSYSFTDFIYKTEQGPKIAIELLQQNELIYYNGLEKDIKKIIFVVSSHKEVEQVIEILKSKYDISTPFSDEMLADVRKKLNSSNEKEINVLNWLRKYYERRNNEY